MSEPTAPPPYGPEDEAAAEEALKALREGLSRAHRSVEQTRAALRRAAEPRTFDEPD